MPDLTYEGLSVGIRERPDQGNMAEVGVIVEGGFVPFARVYLGDMHEAIHEAAKAEADKAEQQPQAEQQQPPPQSGTTGQGVNVHSTTGTQNPQQ